MPQQRKPKRTSLLLIDVEINGQKYHREEFSDGTVQESGRLPLGWPFRSLLGLAAHLTATDRPTKANK